MGAPRCLDRGMPEKSGGFPKGSRARVGVMGWVGPWQSCEHGCTTLVHNQTDVYAIYSWNVYFFGIMALDMRSGQYGDAF